MSESDPFFKDRPVTSHDMPSSALPEDYFQPRQTSSDQLPASVEDDATLNLPDLVPNPKRRGLKAWLISLTAVLAVWIGYDLMLLMQRLLTDSPILAGIFGILLLILLGLSGQQLLISWHNRRRLQQVDQLREMALKMQSAHTREHRQHWLKILHKIYADTSHAERLATVSRQLPDYYHDGEVVQTVDEHFFGKLDQQAMQLIQNHSVNSAVLVAVSQLAIVDTLWVIWRTLKMVNQLNQLYGVRLGTINQWRLNLRICKAAVLSYGTQAGLTLMAEKTSLGLSGKIAGSVAQGVGIGLYQARIGVSAMQQIRPVAFNSNNLPKHRFFSNIARSCLQKIRGQTPQS